MLYIIYHCYYNIHLPYMAAAIHCGYVKKKKFTKAARFLSCPFLLDFHNYIWGKVFYAGIDSLGNKVYFMTYNRAGPVFKRALNGLLSCFGIENQIIFVDTFYCNNYLLSIGTLLLRRGVAGPANIFLQKGFCFALTEISALVEGTLLQLRGIEKNRRS